LFSSFWILSANSWMQTPAGFEIIDGRFFPTDWLQVIFNPSFLSRLSHTVVAFFITTGFVVLGVGAYLLRRGKFAEEGRTMLSMTLWLLTFLVPLQIFLGDHHGLNTLEHQPAKLAAIEARWETGRNIPLTLFAIPDEKTESNLAAIEVPALGSLILTHKLDGEVKGLKDFPADQRPPVAIPFFAFRIMVGCAILMLGIVLLGGWLRWRGRLTDTPLFLLLCQCALPIGFIAVIAGWAVTEVGRQPWTVYGLLRTAASVSPSLSGDFAARLYGGLSLHVPFRIVSDAAHRPRRSGASHRGGCDHRGRTAAGPGAGRRRCFGRKRTMSQVLDFVPIWTLILGIAVFFHVLLDGFDLGVGILFGLAPNTAARNTIMNSIAPIWDGNETWLVLGGLGLLAAFPLAFAIIIPAVYFPILVMLLALVFRGVAFEFRFRDADHKTFWDHAFSYGSAVATFAQGLVLGSFIQGFQVSGRVFSGTSFDFLTPFSILTGIALLFGYGLLGAGWLILKTEGDLQDTARRQGSVCLIGVLAAIGIVSVWTPVMSPAIASRWFIFPNILFLAPVPVATAVVALVTWRALHGHSEILPFAGGIGLFVLSFTGIAISLYPMIVPPHFTLWEAASSDRTQAFLLVGTLVLLPVILMYTSWSYWVFRGKVRADIGYH
jgi:cytochrome bd-type quinol oxidase subunit 2